MEQLIEKKNSLYRVGVVIFILLAVLTVGEYGISAVGVNMAVIFLAIATLKAYLVIRDYMHVGKLFNSEEDHS